MGQQGSREAAVERRTQESAVKAAINLDGTGRSKVNTTVPFYDHILEALSKHSLIDIEITAQGDTHIDTHHTIEDTAIVLGHALKQALGDKRDIRRFGHARVPLDESLADAVVDLSGRSYLSHTGEPEGQIFYQVGGHFTGSMTRHIFEAIAFNAKLCLHMELIRGRDPHHIIEAQFKAFARALRQAVEKDPRMKGVPSTKGVI